MIKKVPARKGFTLLELLVVVGILAALVALALPYYQDYVNQSKLTAAAADINTFKKALAMYDQLEPTMFTGVDFRPLIGKYLQDFRKVSTQQQPVDPWGSSYVLNSVDGTMLCYGPDGSIDPGTTGRTAAGDDIMQTWKPQFFLSSAKRVNPTTIQLVFSRKVQTIAFGNVSASTGPQTATAIQKVSDTIYRLKFAATVPVGDTITVTSGVVVAQDTKQLLSTDSKPDSTAANIATLY